MERFNILLPDISILTGSTLSTKIINQELISEKIIIPNFILAKLEQQALSNKVIGELGIEEIKKLKQICSQKNISLEFYPATLLKDEDIVEKTREIAWEMNATLITSNKIQALSHQAKNGLVNLIFPLEESRILELERFFDQNTMSLHIRENAPIFAKKGTPGNWKMVVVNDKNTSREKIREISQQIIEKTKLQKNSFIEIEREGSIIIQLGDYRIVITEPPFSDGYEITAVRPVAKLNLNNYQLNEKINSRLTQQAAGILIAGSPGEGKTTLARALAEHFAQEGKIVKTIESPRDMLLGDRITQYSLRYSTNDELHDVLLLSRPDKTFFDEIRNHNDFQLYADLRLAGIGMIGVVHATAPIDAIQRFIGKIEMGIIPQIIDTVVFVKAGKISNILELKMVVKVPTGMKEADLARPVVEVRDFSNGGLEFEIYSYGEHTVIVPTKRKERKACWDLAAERISEYFQKYSEYNAVKFIDDEHIQVFLPQSDISNVIGIQGKEIENIENELNLKIDILELDKDFLKKKNSKEIDYELELEDNNILIYLNKDLCEKEVSIYDREDLLLQARSSKKAQIKQQKQKRQ